MLSVEKETNCEGCGEKYKSFTGFEGTSILDRSRVYSFCEKCTKKIRDFIGTLKEKEKEIVSVCVACPKTYSPPRPHNCFPKQEKGCGDCYFCRKGNPEHCGNPTIEELKELRYESKNFEGLFPECADLFLDLIGEHNKIIKYLKARE